MVLDDNNRAVVSILRNYITAQNEAYKLNESDINTICEAYSAMFPQPNAILSSRTKGIDGHLSILRPSMLDRYFILELNGRLSEIKFSKMRNSSFDEFKSKLTDLSKNKDLVIDIADRLESI